MIKVGDIVFRKFKGGFRNNRPNTDKLGLVIKEHNERGAIAQYYVRFDSEDPKWFYQHELHRIQWGERKKND
tara:strand:- start:549 stop:764 length:216 start_codon:yes stop_codon:yes gene_type:complete